MNTIVGRLTLYSRMHSFEIFSPDFFFLGGGGRQSFRVSNGKVCPRNPLSGSYAARRHARLWMLLYFGGFSAAPCAWRISSSQPPGMLKSVKGEAAKKPRRCQPCQSGTCISGQKCLGLAELANFPLLNLEKYLSQTLERLLPYQFFF